MEAAVGARLEAGTQEARPSRSLCTFAVTASAEESVVLVSTSSSDVPAAFDAARSAAQDPQPVIAGDQAFVSGGQALVRKGDTMVVILVVLRREPAELVTTASKLAQLVGTHL